MIFLKRNTNNIFLPILQSDGKSGKKPELATVIAPYTASSKEQLSLQKGQMILVRKKTETGWWQGEIQASGTVSSILRNIETVLFLVATVCSSVTMVVEIHRELKSISFYT